MRKIIVSEFISLDGVMQAPGGADEDTEGGFVHGGWTWPYWHDDIGATFAESMSQCDTLLLGQSQTMACRNFALADAPLEPGDEVWI
jgi:hypothetical protein